MPVDYGKIRETHQADYGRKVGEYGIRLAELSPRSTQFSLELLQNAEDALEKREDGWSGSRRVTIELERDRLVVKHFGAPFDEDDVRKICSLFESSKDEDLTTIGRIGIGFKSVYRVTDMPQIHSGGEAFQIKTFVHPWPIDPIERDPAETMFILPFKSYVGEANERLMKKSIMFDDYTLLFLSNVDEIRSYVNGTLHFGQIRKSTYIDELARRVEIFTNSISRRVDADNWLVFSRKVVEPETKSIGRVEIAFKHESDEENFEDLRKLPAFVYFPTAIQPDTGFVIHGPYRTTLARDNIPDHEKWNQHLVCETVLLIGDAIRWFRNRDRLSVNVLRCLPLSQPSGVFSPLFDGVRQLMEAEAFLPRHGGGFVTAQNALMARTAGLRDVFSADQVSGILDMDKSMAWLDDSVRRNREVSDYVTGHLGVQEVRPQRLIPRLTRDFLENQSDEWIVGLYSFLKEVPSAIDVQDAPELIRLEDGEHVAPFRDGEPQAYLPCDAKTGFPTVKKALCEDPTALSFLRSIGLNKPDLVDDVVRNVLPRYRTRDFEPSSEEYVSHIERIANAYRQAPPVKRLELQGALENVAWVKAVDFGDGVRRRMPPREIYLPTPSLRGLLSNVAGFMFVDDEVKVLMCEDVQGLLKACGAVDHLRPIRDNSKPSEDELQEARRRAGHEGTSGRGDRVEGYDLREIEELLYGMRKHDPQSQTDVANGLWRELKHLHQIQGSDVFERTYSWTDYGGYSTKLDPKFVRKLNSSSWIPAQSGQLECPSDVLFSDLGWDEDAFLQSKILFKPPKIHELANEVGIEPDVLELLKQRNLTTISKLREVGIFVDQTSGNGRAGETDEYRDDSEPFAKRFFEMQTKNPTQERDRPVLLPEGGPKTGESAKLNAQRSTAISGSGSRRRISGIRWIPTEASR